MSLAAAKDPKALTSPAPAREGAEPQGRAPSRSPPQGAPTTAAGPRTPRRRDLRVPRSQRWGTGAGRRRVWTESGGGVNQSGDLLPAALDLSPCACEGFGVAAGLRSPPRWEARPGATDPPPGSAPSSPPRRSSSLWGRRHAAAISAAAAILCLDWSHVALAPSRLVFRRSVGDILRSHTSCHLRRLWDRSRASLRRAALPDPTGACFDLSQGSFISRWTPRQKTPSSPAFECPRRAEPPGASAGPSPPGISCGGGGLTVEGEDFTGGGSGGVLWDRPLLALFLLAEDNKGSERSDFSGAIFRAPWGSAGASALMTAKTSAM